MSLVKQTTELVDQWLHADGDGPVDDKWAVKVVGALRAWLAADHAARESLDTDLLYRAVEALEFKAHYDAGVSSADTGGLISKEATQEWEDARILRIVLDQAQSAQAEDVE